MFKQIKEFLFGKPEVTEPAPYKIEAPMYAVSGNETLGNNTASVLAQKPAVKKPAAKKPAARKAPARKSKSSN